MPLGITQENILGMLIILLIITIRPTNSGAKFKSRKVHKASQNWFTVTKFEPDMYFTLTIFLTNMNPVNSPFKSFYAKTTEILHLSPRNKSG